MLAASAEAIAARVPGTAAVLDVGGGARPLPRADWVLDLMPYADRGLYGPPPDPAAERFSEATWVVRDICDHTPWPFADGQFDFAVCSHTLEDVRDPLWVCHELQRVARAGYIEVPSRLEEQSLGVHGPWVGWSHHRWLIDIADGAIVFTHKPHFIHARASDHFAAGHAATLSESERVQTLWWEGAFASREWMPRDAAEIDAYVAGFVARHAGHGRRAPVRGPVRATVARRALGRLRRTLR